MGTSSSYQGPKGHTNLLPPWAAAPMANADDVPLDNLEGQPTDAEVSGPTDRGQLPNDSTVSSLPPLVPIVSWRVPKTLLSRRARGRGNVSLSSVGRAYVRASGGSRTAARAASTGRSTTGRLGSFLSDGLRNGFVQAVQHLGLRDFLGRGAQYLLASFIDLLAPDGALREEAAARAALIDTMAELFERFDVETNGIEALDQMDYAGMQAIVALSITNYINARFQQELVSRIEGGTLSEHEANSLATEIKDFIAGIIRLDFGSSDLIAIDWRGPQGQQLVEQIYQTAYGVLGDDL